MRDRLFVIGQEVYTVFVEAEGEEVVLDGARSIQAPAVGSDALGELGLHGSLGGEARDEGFGEFVVSRAVFRQSLW